ncbi:TetR family transcriptional regulator [Streptomyces niveus]|uniref:hypothetical protein n=1 Tax=Streptomyces niveus TaxID=193462 RepID=UPI002E3370E5|nr:hypothetical protein [Streptomyces niveus]
MTLNEIAATAGVHASAVRRYFESREGIYLRLAATEWDGWATTVEGELDRAGTLSARDLAAVLARTLADDPLRTSPTTSGDAEAWATKSVKAVESAGRVVGRGMLISPRKNA